MTLGLVFKSVMVSSAVLSGVYTASVGFSATSSQESLDCEFSQIEGGASVDKVIGKLKFDSGMPRIRLGNAAAQAIIPGLRGGIEVQILKFSVENGVQPVFSSLTLRKPTDAIELSLNSEGTYFRYELNCSKN